MLVYTTMQVGPHAGPYSLLRGPGNWAFTSRKTGREETEAKKSLDIASGEERLQGITRK